MQKQDTEFTKYTKFTKQSCQCKLKINLFSTCQSTQIKCDEHSKHFADEFRYDSDLQSCEQLLNYSIFSNLCKIMKTVRTAEILRINKISILYMIMTNQISENQLQLDDFYMNTVMKLALNIAIKYELSLEKKSQCEKKFNIYLTSLNK